MTSHVEGYLCAMQEQEIRTRLLDKQRNISVGSDNGKCSHCKSVDESIFHILGACDKLSSRMYLPVRHNEVAKVVYNEVITETKYIAKPDPIIVMGDIEVWKYDGTKRSQKDPLLNIANQI